MRQIRLAGQGKTERVGVKLNLKEVFQLKSRWRLLLVISFANIFCQSTGCLFVLSVVYFVVQKFLSWIRSHLFIFAFISFALGDKSKVILLWCMSKSVLPIFSLGIVWFLVLYLGLKSNFSLFLSMVLEKVVISFFYM